MAGLFSMELSCKGLPKSFVTQEGRAGVLLGMESRTLPRHFPTPFGEVRLVTVKALMPSEGTYLATHGTRACRTVAAVHGKRRTSPVARPQEARASASAVSNMLQRND